MKPGTRISVATALSALAIAGVGGSASAERPESAKAGQKASCKITLALARSTYATYVQSLSVKRTSCGKGWKVVRAFHACRKQNGGKNGRCKSRVKGYKCNEGKRTGVKGVRYNADVSCKRGAKRVKHTYSMSL